MALKLEYRSFCELNYTRCACCREYMNDEPRVVIAALDSALEGKPESYHVPCFVSQGGRVPRHDSRSQSLSPS